MDVRLFLPILALLVGLAVGNDSLVHRKVFSFMGDGHYDLGHLEPGELYRVKLEQARRSPRFEIGVFGNSRSLSLGAADLAVGPGKFFNFSMPTQTILGVHKVLHELQEMDKIPNVLIVFQDNPFIYSFHYPYILEVANEYELLRWSVEEGLNFGRLVRTLRLEAGMESGAQGSYAADGAWRSSPGAIRESEIESLGIRHEGRFSMSQTEFWDPEAMLYRLGTVYTGLGMLVAKGHAVIVVETLLPWPVYLTEQVQAPAAEVREFMRNMATKLGIVYVTEAELRNEIGSTDLMWTDPTHPPRELLVKSLEIGIGRWK